MENITLAMIPEFEFDDETSKKFCAWAALNSLEAGTSEEDVLVIYGMKREDLEPYREEYEKLK